MFPDPTLISNPNNDVRFTPREVCANETNENDKFDALPSSNDKSQKRTPASKEDFEEGSLSASPSPEEETNRRNCESKAEDKKRERTIIKNLLIISISIMLLFTATQSVDKLQSSVHFQDELGTTTLSVVNALNVIGSFFIAAYVIKRFGPKLILVVSMFGFLTYIVVNFYAKWYTLIPIAVVFGLASATLYAALWSYIGTLGTEYSILTRVSTEVIYARFYGLFFMFIQSSSVWGNVISFKVLDQGSDGLSNKSNLSCGAYFCDSQVSDADIHFEGVPDNFYLLCGIFTGVAIVAIVFALFLDRQMPKLDEGSSTLQRILETAKKVTHPIMLLMFPITFYGGLQFAFIVGDYTKAYITCPFGVANVGYVFICYGVVSTVFALVVGHLVKVLGREAVFALSALTDIGVYCTLAFYSFEVHAIPIHFVLIGLLGVTTGVWQGQIKALYGSLFPDCQEVAFSLLGVFEPLGIAISFAYSSRLCTITKLYILFAFLFLGMLGFGIVETRVRRGGRQRRSTDL